MSTPQAAEATQWSESPKITSSQETIGSTPSQVSPETTKSQECPLSPGWVHTITIILGHSCLLQEKHQEGRLSLLSLER